MVFPFHVLVGSIDYPAETTVSCLDAGTLNEVLQFFLPGGEMHRPDCPGIAIYPAGSKVPDEVAVHVDR